MGTFTVTAPDGQTFKVEAGSKEEALSIAKSKFRPAPNRNPGVQPDAPPEMILNPNTGQYTSRELLGAAVDPGRAQSAQVGGMQGLAFGGADEAMGAANAAIPGPGTAPERYTFGRDYTRAVDDAARQNHPVVRGASEVGGALASTAAAYANMQAPLSLGGRVGQGMKLGAGEGALYGGMSGEGLGDRLAGAAQMGLLGTGLGGAAPIVAALLRKGGTAVADVVGGLGGAVRNVPSQSRANRALYSTLERSGRSVDDIADDVARATADGQPEYRLADALGIAGQRRLSGIARSGGDASAEITDFLNARQTAQPERIAQFTADAFDLEGSSAKAVRGAIREGRDEAADIAFGGIRSAGEPVDIRSVVSVLDGKIAPYEKAGISDTGVDYLKTLRGQLAAKGEDATYELSDFDKVFAIRKRLRDKISSLYKAGESDLARDLKEVRAALDDALAASSDEYRSAMEAYASQSRVLDAVDEGAEMARPSQRATDTTARFSGMTADQQAAARVGYGDRLLSQIEASAGDSNRARPLTSTKRQAEAEAMAIDPRLFTDRINREGTMFDTRRIALGGSRTADNLEDIADLKPYDTNMIVNALTGKWGTAGAQAAQGLSNVATGMNQPTRQEIARALLSRDPAALRNAVTQASMSAEDMAIVEELLRAIGQRNAPALIE